MNKIYTFISFILTIFYFFASPSIVIAQCGAGQSLFTNCYNNNEIDQVVFEICPTAGMAAQATIIGGSYGTFDEVDNLTVYEGASGSGTSGTIYLGSKSGNLTGDMITGGTDQCLIFVSNSNGVISCDGGYESQLQVCGESVADGTVQFTAPSDFCVTDGIQSGLGGGFPFGGVYSGTGVTDDGNGTSFSFNPATAGIGVHTLTYTRGGNFTTAELEVFAVPTVGFTALANLCIDAGIQYGLGGGTPVGGVYSGLGVTDDRNGTTYTFNPGLAGLGTHTITYTEGTVCMITATDDVEVLAACGCPMGQNSFFHCKGINETDLVIFEVCPDAGEIAQANIDQGTYDFGNSLTVYQGASGSGTGGTIVYGSQRGDLSGDIVTATAVDACLIFVSNTLVIGCELGFETPLEVCGESLVSSFNALDDLCIDQGLQITLGGGLPTGGIYSGSGLTDDGIGMTYSFDPVAAGAGLHSITYTINGNPVIDDVEVFAVPSVSFTAQDDLCIDAGIQRITGGGLPVGGVYSGTGITDNGDGLTYNFDPVVAGIGVQSLTYIEGSTCFESATDNIEVLTACSCPVGATTYFNCYDNNENDLVIFEVCPGAGEFAKGIINQGTYDEGDDYLAVYQGASGSGNSGTLMYGPTNGNLTGNTITATLADECLIFISNSGPVVSCIDKFESSLIVCGSSLNSNISFTALNDLSVNAGIQTGLGNGLPTGGVYSGPGVTDNGNGMTYTFDPVTAGVGIHTLSYTFGGDIATDDVEVFNLLPPTFSKAFDMTEIGPGGVTTLTFTIENPASGTGVSNLDFTDNLPAGMTIAAPANVSNSCGLGTTTAPDGGTTISYTGGTLTSGSSCAITVDITSSTTGTHVNTTGDLTSSSGNSGTATANLTVSTNRPGFTKSFSPASINMGERSTLTFTIDNTANAGDMNSLNFTDNLPTGMVVADPPNIAVSCTGGTVSTIPGSNIITYDYPFTFPALAAGASCTVTVDVTATGAGTLNNVTGQLTGLNASFATVSSGKASAALEVYTSGDILIQKSFSTNPVQPGGTTNLEFTITNFDRDFEATNISFTDDLTSLLAGLTATGTPVNNICGTGSQISGTTLLTFTGGTIPAQGSCTFSVTLSIPGGAAVGSYTNTTSAISGEINSSTVTGNTATEKLNIANSPTITKNFLNDPIPAGGTTTVEFMITNNSSTSALTNITFSDNISDFISGATVSSLPAAGSCGASSAFTSFESGGKLLFQMTGGEIAAGESCTFSVDLSIPTNMPSGSYTNITGYLSATVDGQPALGNPASDDLEVMAIPRLTKSFTDDPVDAGDIVNLEFTLTYDDFATGDATNISFADDLNAVLAGMSAMGLPTNNICGTGSQISGTTNLMFTNGTLSPGGTCTFSIPVQVPAGVSPGSYTNTTSTVSSTVGGQSGTRDAATDDLLIGGLTLSKEFLDNPIIPGELTTLRYTIDNTTTFDATSIVFTDNLNDALSGLRNEAPLPSSPCGATFSSSGDFFIIFNGGTVTAGNSCSFDVPVRVPLSATSGTYPSITSNLTATINSSSVVLSPANDALAVNDNLIALSKTFTDDPILPQGTVTVEYTLENLDADNAIGNIAFTDDFDGILSGLQATGLPASVCGGTASGTSMLSFSGGSLAAGGTCTFSITLQTPASASYGSSVTSVTSSLTGTVNGFPVIGDPASDVLKFQALQFSKSFSSSVKPGESATLTFTITNPDLSNSVNVIRFTDNLDAFISGAVATNLPLNNTCGTGSTVTGISTIVFDNGVLGSRRKL